MFFPDHHGSQDRGLATGRRRFLASALALLATGPGSACAMTQPAGRARAEALVAAYARHVGADGRQLDAADDVSLGSSGLHYDVPRDTLVGRVYVQKAMLQGAPPEEMRNLRRMVGALNDPAVGGMFDQGGGTFVLYEDKDAYFLVREFPVAATSPQQLIDGMERMQAVTPTWVVRWFYRVAMIMHGHQTAPTHPVTLEHPDE